MGRQHIMTINGALVAEAVCLDDGQMSMIFHNFDSRELPLVAENRERNFFLAKAILDGKSNRLSTDLEEILP